MMVLFTIIFLLSGCGNKNDSNNSKDLNNNVNASRTSITKDLNNALNIDDNSNNNDNKNSNDNSDNNKPVEPKETELSVFSTPLKSGGAGRITNIKLTCGKINELVLKQGESFSFNQIVGPCTSEEGYQKAEIYVNKKIKFALGGGNCQVSTTLYNAALAVPGIEITERHEHNR